MTTSIHNLQSDVNLTNWHRFRTQFAATIADSLKPSLEDVYEALNGPCIFRGYIPLNYKCVDVWAHECCGGHAVVVKIPYSSTETYFVDAENVVWWVGKQGLTVRDQTLKTVVMIHDLAYSGWAAEDED